MFSPDGTLLATASADRTARLWDAAGRGAVEPLTTLTGHTDPVYEVVFSPDGTLLATGADRTVRLWDAAGRGAVEPLATLTGHTGIVRDVVFSPDGTLLATGGDDDNTVRLWDLEPGRVVDRACANPDNHITAEEWDEYVPDVPYDPPCD